MALRQWIFAVATILSASDIPAQETEQSGFPEAVQRVLDHDPLSCAAPDADVTGTTACLAEAGAFQMGRLSLSTESFARALALVGVANDDADIQAAILSDVAKFGPRGAIAFPAMTLVDITSTDKTLLGEHSEEIKGLSLLAS